MVLELHVSLSEFMHHRVSVWHISIHLVRVPASSTSFVPQFPQALSF